MMRSLSKFKKMSAVFLCLLLTLLCAGCQQNDGGGYKEIEVPLKDVAWGMEQSEVLEKLGLKETDVVFKNDSKTAIALTPEQAGMEAIAGMKVSEAYSPAVSLFFKEYDGKNRLAMVDVDVHAESGAKVKESLTASYGEPTPFGSGFVWTSVSPDEKGADKDFEKIDEFTLGSYLQLSGGEKKLFVIRPIITVPTTTKDGAQGNVFGVKEEADFTLHFNADPYLASQYGAAK